MRFIPFVLFFFVLANKVQAQPAVPPSATEYVSALKKVTDVMLNDVASPVAAGRYYAYITLAAYEVQSLFAPAKFPSLAVQLNIPLQSPAIEKIKEATIGQAVIFTILKTGEKMLPSGYLLKPAIDSLVIRYKKKYKNSNQINASAGLADEMVKQLVARAGTDGFKQLNNRPRYTPKTGGAYWQPTAPVFMAPIEPHWNTIRPFLLDSAQQFKPQPPALFDTAINSSFYKQMLETAEAVSNGKKSDQDIANFWDCNPFAVQQIGHVEFGIKKISPGGHWISIAGIACKKKKFSLQETVLTHVLLSLVINDAFIACWDEKYRSNRVRPETAINQLLDPRWRPLLQTPPFPEYVSGHSVVSTASSIVLSKIFGNAFAYTDDSEVEFGLPKRKYQSFKQAAAEAAISRLYGGIHYRDGIEQGIWQGKKVGELGVEKLKQFFSLMINNPG
jgi:hypothetical protein